jgi:hypothetical protein
MGYKRAFVLQDDMPLKLIPWDEVAAVFLGGTDAYKLTHKAIKTCEIAKRKGKLVHVGRVNSVKRIRHFIGVMDSFDGLTYSKFSNTHLSRTLEFLTNNCMGPGCKRHRSVTP